MTDLTPINDNCSPLEHELETSIMDLHVVKNLGEPCCPERAMAFSFEYIPWADHNGEHDDILTATIVGKIDPKIGSALISHIVATGTPMTSGELIYATGLENRVSLYVVVGGLFGAAGVMLAQLAVLTF